MPASTTPARLTRAVRWLVINLGLLLGLLLLLEGALRLLGAGGPPPKQRFWVYHATFGWFSTPHARSSDDRGGPDAGNIVLNSRGFRGPEVEPLKPPGTVRIAVLGDSFVFGGGVDEEHLFTAEMQRLLSERAPTRYEVLNAGMDGYSTDQEWLLYREDVRPLRPDVVVLVACDNDFEANTLDLVYRRYYKPYFTAEGGQLHLHNVPVPQLDFVQRLKLWLGDHSRAWSSLQSRRSERESVRRLLGWFQVAQGRGASEDPLALTLQLVEALAGDVAADGAEIVVVSTGHRGENAAPLRVLKNRLRARGIPWMGLQGPLAEARQREPARHWDWPDNSHWNVDSHRLVARLLLDLLAREGILERRERLVAAASGSEAGRAARPAARGSGRTGRPAS
jgi:hypothetical protein